MTMGSFKFEFALKLNDVTMLCNNGIIDNITKLIMLINITKLCTW